VIKNPMQSFRASFSRKLYSQRMASIILKDNFNGMVFIALSAIEKF